MKIEFNPRTRAEGMLVNALQRLLNGEPIRVKANGRLTLNRVNEEAGLGHGYIYKFKEFMEYANPIIDESNANKQKELENSLLIDESSRLSDIDVLKAKLKKATELKNRYRKERDNAIKARKILEHKYSEMMYRANELQIEISSHNDVVVPIKNGD
ncbi:hypothetical protein [Vibrio campbellii]|uniref:hypothetical protein n=1 Tax=Vibrio campbellii TaxID=680 RepID=UPI0005ED623D|nr:hypothetical protein [Vibrio campbellii]